MKKVIFLWLILAMCAGSMIYFTEDVRAGNSEILINEIYYDTNGQDSEEEWIEIINIGLNTIDISQYKIGDEETRGGGEGMYQWPADASIKAGEQLVVARDAVGFYRLYGKFPDYEMNSADDNSTDFSNTPDLKKYSSWGSGVVSLTNTGDEVLLLDGNDQMADAAVYEGGVLPGINPHPGTISGESLSRINLTDTDDCEIDFKIRENPSPGYEWIYRAEDYPGDIGLIDTENSWRTAQVSQDMAGYLFYGPYTFDQPEGLFQASFRLRVNDNTSSNPVVRIDANNYDGDGQWVYRDILGADFVTAGEWQNFDLSFMRTGSGTMEYRVWFYGVADLAFEEVMISPLDRLVWEAEEMVHQTGSVINDGTERISWASDEAGHLIYGPYINLPAGFYNLNFVSASDDVVSTDHLLQIEAITNRDDYYKRSLNGLDFDEINVYQANRINFVNNDRSKIWEFRLATTGFNEIRCDQVILTLSDNLVFEGEESPGFGETQTDISASGKEYRLADPTINDAGWMVYGPYLTLAPGNYKANYWVKIGADTDEVAGVINMTDVMGHNPEITVALTGDDFDQLDQWQKFSQEFELTQPALMEWRVWFNDTVDLGVDRVEVSKIN